MFEFWVYFFLGVVYVCVCVRGYLFTFCAHKVSENVQKVRDTQSWAWMPPERSNDPTKKKDTCQRPNYCNQTKNEYHKATRKKKQKLLQIFQSILRSTGRCHWVCRVFTFFSFSSIVQTTTHANNREKHHTESIWVRPTVVFLSSRVRVLV